MSFQANTPNIDGYYLGDQEQLINEPIDHPTRYGTPTNFGAQTPVPAAQQVPASFPGTSDAPTSQLTQEQYVIRILDSLMANSNTLTSTMNAIGQLLEAQASQPPPMAQPPRQNPPPPPNPPSWPAASAAPNPPSTHRPSLKIREPRVFDGRVSEVDGFVNEMDDCIFLQRKSFDSERDKCYYFGRYLKDGSPVEWFTNLKRENSSLLDNYDLFLQSFRKHFGTSDETALYLRKLRSLTQTGAVSQYISKFHEIVAHLTMSEQSKIAEFKKGLKDDLKEFLIGKTVPATLQDFEPIVIQVDNDLHEFNLEKKSRSDNKSKNSNSSTSNKSTHGYVAPKTPFVPYAPRASIPSGTEVVPMEVDALQPAGRIKLTQEERKRRSDNGLCMYAGCDLKDAKVAKMHESGKDCPVKIANHSGKGKST